MDFSNLFPMEPTGQGWLQFVELLLAFILSSCIGLEREYRLKSAGLRTHALVGLASALMMLISKYGFTNVLVSGHVVLDPSRVAAQIVTGIGFIGGGLIFVRRDVVHGLTTAAVVWLTAAVGMACGAGLPLLAVFATIGHFIVVYGYTFIMGRIIGQVNRLHVLYQTGHDVLSHVLPLCAEQEFTVSNFTLQNSHDCAENAAITLTLQGRLPVSSLVESLAAMPHVLAVTLNPPEEGH